MKFSINHEMFAKYPRMRIGYVVAEFTNPKTHPYVEDPLISNLSFITVF